MEKIALPGTVANIPPVKDEAPQGHAQSWGIPPGSGRIGEAIDHNRRLAERPEILAERWEHTAKRWTITTPDRDLRHPGDPDSLPIRVSAARQLARCASCPARWQDDPLILQYIAHYNGQASASERPRYGEQTFVPIEGLRLLEKLLPLDAAAVTAEFVEVSEDSNGLPHERTVSVANVPIFLVAN
jgi:hypothetical protein